METDAWRRLGRAVLALCAILAAGGCDTTTHATADGGAHDGPVGPLAIAAQDLPGGQAHVRYAAALAASGGLRPYGWSISVGALPAGVTLDAATGALGGVPEAPGDATFTAAVADAAGQTATQAFTLHIGAAPSAPSVTTTQLPDAQAGAAYDQTLAVTGGRSPYAWMVIAGQLPPGLTLDLMHGSISGTPAQPGDFPFTVQVLDSSTPSQRATAPLTIHVGLPPPIALTTTSLPAGQVGTAYHATLAATGGLPPYHWLVYAGVLPAGLTLDAGSGAVSGTPAAAGTTQVTIRVTDSFAAPAHAERIFTITIAEPPPELAVSTSALPGGVVGTAYSATLQATGGVPPYTWAIAAGTLPDGLALDATTGAITGTPTTAGTADLTLEVTDSTAATASAQLSLVVTTPALSVTTSSLPPATIDVPYSATLQAGGGTPGYTWAITSGSLPAGLTLDGATGAISGTPTALGPAPFTVEVTDAAATPATATRQLGITVEPAPLVITTATLPDGSTTAAYSATLAATGGTGATTWSITAGTLPAGLTLDPATGQISGTPTETGTFTITFQVTDSATPTAQTATRQLTLNVPA
jgi:hypothetical protein